MKYKEPHIIIFDKIGNPLEGYLSVCQSNHAIPFDVRRVFWTYYTPDGVTRGRHTHHQTEMILIALSGRIQVKTESLNKEKQEFILDSPNQGLYIPPYTWHVMDYSHTSVQLVVASTEYDESDYIRDYTSFQKLQK